MEQSLACRYQLPDSKHTLDEKREHNYLKSFNDSFYSYQIYELNWLMLNLF